jgi:hypothetical protein
MTDAFILGGTRTPFGRYGGSLSHIRTDDLLGMTMRDACERVGLPLEQVQDIVAGCVNTAHEGMGDVARWAALAAGFPDSVAGATINRFCGSSVSATINISHAIMAGDLEVGIACGVESMSRSGWAYMKGGRSFLPARSRFSARHHVGRGRRSTEPGSDGPKRLHLDDRDGAERSGPVPTDTGGDRRFRAAISAAGRCGPRFRPAGQRDHAGVDPGDEDHAGAGLRTRRVHSR